MTAPRFSIVVPTFDRAERLARVLDALARESAAFAGGVETIVVDDGSGDETRRVLATRGATVRALRQENAGPARARNRGAAAAGGELLVFLGDDVEPCAGFLAAHDAAHRNAPRDGRALAVLGRTDWDAGRMRVTPLLRHLEENGLQFGWSLIRDPEDVPFNFFYTSNVSLPRAAFAALGGFDERFRGAAWEDVEFAWRATRPGAAPRLRLVFRPEARATHDHPTGVASFRRRQRASGGAAATFARLRPELADWLGVPAARALPPSRPASLAVVESLVALADVAGIPLPGALYDRLFRWDYLRGLGDALSNETDTLGSATLLQT